MPLNSDFLDQTKHRTLIFVKTISTAENATLTTSIVPICFPIATILIAPVSIDNFASRLSVLSVEGTLGLDGLEGPGFAMDGQCRERGLCVQITAPIKVEIFSLVFVFRRTGADDS
jgi:hypothetical protein